MIAPREARPRVRVALGYALIATAACSWGTWPLILRRAEAVAPMHPAFESTVLMAVLTLVSAPFCLADRVRVRANARAWMGVAWLGVADALNVLLFFGAYQTTTVAIAVLTHYLTPIFVALAAPFVLGERIGSRTMGATAASFAGLVLLLAPWSRSGAHDLLGALLGAGSAVFYASNVLVNKRLVPVFSAPELAFFHGLVATPFLAAFVPRGAWHVDPHAVAVLALGSIGPGALAGLFFTWGLRSVRAAHASTLALLEPLVAVILGALAFGERPGGLAIVGAALILAGAAAVVTARASD